jgi:hypothetical protein
MREYESDSSDSGQGPAHALVSTFRVLQDGGTFSRGISGGAQLRVVSQWDGHSWHQVPKTTLELRVA